MPKKNQQAANFAPAQTQKVLLSSHSKSTFPAHEYQADNHQMPTPVKKQPPPGTATPQSSSPFAPGSSANEGEDVQPGSSSKRQKKAGAAARDPQDEAMFDAQDEEDDRADEVEGPAEREKKKVISHFTQKYFFDLDADDYLGYHEEERYG
jgi:hypothetical protein